MPDIQLIKKQDDFQLEKGWKNYFTHGEIVDASGYATTATSEGHKYKVLSKHAELLTWAESIYKIFEALVLIILSLGLALISKEIRDVFITREKTIKLFVVRYLNDTERAQKNMATLNKIYAECHQKTPEECQEFQDTKNMTLQNFSAEQTFKLLKRYRDNELPKDSFAREFETLEGWVNGTNADLKKRHLLWMGENLRRFKKQLDQGQNQWLSDEKILRAIQTFARPDLRPSLCNVALAVAKNPEGQMHLGNLCSGKAYKGLDKLLRLIAAQFMQEGVQETTIRKLLAQTDSLDALHQKTNSRILIATLLQLLETKMISANEKQDILERIIAVDSQDANENTPESKAESKAERILTNLKSVSGTITFGAPEALLLHHQTLPTILENVFRQKVPVRKVDNFVDAFYQTFGSCRKPSAIINYAAKIRELDDPEVTACFSDYVTSVLRGNFTEKRYQTTNNPHLEKLEKSQPGLLEKWRQSLPPIPLDTTDTAEAVSEEKKMEIWLNEKLLNDADLSAESLPVLVAYLQEDNEPVRQEILQNFAEKVAQDKLLESQHKEALLVKTDLFKFEETCLKLMTEARKKQQQICVREFDEKHLKGIFPDQPLLCEKLSALKAEVDGQEKSVLCWDALKQILAENVDSEALGLTYLNQALKSDKDPTTLSKQLLIDLKKNWAKSKADEAKSINVAKLQQHCLQLITEKDPEERQKILESIRDLLQRSFPECSFLKDVKECIKLLSKPKLITANIRVEDTDEPINLLLFTTEGGNDSCLSIDWYIEKNKCLLAYMMDGKNRALVVQDTQDVILARCVIRLMLDNKGNAYLLREKFYPFNTPVPEHYIKGLNAMAEQKAAQLGIPLVCMDGNGAECPTLIAGKSPVPYEYCDAADGYFYHGNFEVHNARLYK